jgi:predicted dehydrogenase
LRAENREEGGFMANQQIKLGIIGAGSVTTDKGRHIDSFRELNDPDAKIVALADIIPGFAQKVADRFSIARGFDDYRRLLEMEEINAVVINTPTNTHKQIAIDALKAGKHVYAEKPITNSCEELKELVDVARASGRIFLGGSNGLLQRQMATFRNMIDEGLLGEVYFVSIERAYGKSTDYGMATRPKMKDGVSMHSGSHNVEWALYFLGDPKAVSVSAKGYYKNKNISVPWQGRNEDDDCCIATVQFDNGSTFLYKALRAAPIRNIYDVKIYGDEMSIEYDVHKCYKHKSDDCIVFHRYNKLTGMEEIRPLYKCERGHAAMYRHFFNCIRENKLEISRCERGLETMRILDAMVQSIELGGKQIAL